MTSYEDLSDEQLVERARHDDQQALAGLARRCESKLRARIRSRLAPALRRKVAASDVLQEAHLVALRQLAEFEIRGDGSFERWFGKIVELKIREAVRHHAGVQKRGAGREVGWSRFGSRAGARHKGPSPSQVLVGKELREEIRLAFDQLPDDHREVLRLLQGENRKVDEVAAQMKRSVAATRKLYGRALANLEQLIGIERDGRRKPTR